jgi:hypothetical protein
MRVTRCSHAKSEIAEQNPLFDSRHSIEQTFEQTSGVVAMATRVVTALF